MSHLSTYSNRMTAHHGAAAALALLVGLFGGCYYPYEHEDVISVPDVPGGPPSTSPYACFFDDSLPAGGESRIRCVSDPSVACSGGAGGVFDAVSCYAGFMCPHACQTAADCPGADGSTASPTCFPGGPESVCRLDCENLDDCPDGMICYGGSFEPRTCMWFYASPCSDPTGRCCDNP